MPDEAIRLVWPMVTQVKASIAPSDAEHIAWSVGYAPEVDDDDDGRFIIARLHAGSPAGRVSVEISALHVGEPTGRIIESDREGFESALKESEALETLYDIARITASTALGMVSVALSLPTESPDADISRLVRAVEQDDTQSS